MEVEGLVQKTSQTTVTPSDVLMQGLEQAVRLGDQDIPITSDTERLPAFPALLPAAEIMDNTRDMVCDSTVDIEDFIESVIDTTQLAAATGPTPHGTPLAQRIPDPDGCSPNRIEAMFKTALGTSTHAYEEFLPLDMGDVVMAEGGPGLWDVSSREADSEYSRSHCESHI
jgi:hypothetical protein